MIDDNRPPMPKSKRPAMIALALLAVVIIGGIWVWRESDKEVEEFRQAQYDACIHEKQFPHDLFSAYMEDMTGRNYYEPDRPNWASSSEVAECKAKAGLQ
jgi:hypothetical protein